MANVGTSSIKIRDEDGDVVSVTNNRLDVNATLVAGATIDIGDVDMFLDGGTALLGDEGAVAPGVLRVTIATDDNVSTKLTTISSNITTIIKAEDAVHSSSDKGIMPLVVRKDIGGSLASHDGDYAPLQVTSTGALRVASSATNAGTFVVQEDGAALTALQLIDDAIYVDDADFSLDTNKGIAIMGFAGDNTITSGDVGVISVTDTGHVRTVTNLGTPETFAMIDVDNAAEQLSATVGTVTDCIEMLFQADESNSGYVIIGDSDVADNRGIKLNAGDTLILNVDDTRNVYLWGSAADQNVRCMVNRY